VRATLSEGNGFGISFFSSYGDEGPSSLESMLYFGDEPRDSESLIYSPPPPLLLLTSQICSGWFRK
jgi:hypothetical protein